MAAQNQHWYNQNEGRNYPVNDVCSGIDDAGVNLPSDIITDIRLRWPVALGEVAFVSAVTVSPGVVTVLIQVASSLTATDSFVSVASISVPVGELDQGRQYALRPQQPQTAGYITFGSGVLTRYSGRFSRPNQTALSPRAARAFKALPVQSLSKVNTRQNLSGVVQLLGQDPVLVVKEVREIDEISREVIVIKLLDSTEQDTEVRRSILEQFAGPCRRRPESKNCGNPQPIETINTVTPNCNGEIIIDFTGRIIAGTIPSDCGVFLDLDVGMEDVCVPPILPDADGVLPTEVAPLAVVPPLVDDEEDVDVVIDDEVIVLGEFPYCVRFNSLAASDFEAESGTWEYLEAPELAPGEVLRENLLCPFLPEELPAEYPGTFAPAAATAFINRNILLWYGFDVTTFNRIVQTDIKLLQGQPGAKRNASIAINTRIDINGLMTYYCLELDYDTQSLRLLYFNGNVLTQVAKVTRPGIVLNHWYRLTVETTPVNGQGVFITGTLRSATDADFPIAPGVSDIPLVVLGPLLATKYLPDTGHFGLATNRAKSEFSCFKITASD